MELVLTKSKAIMMKTSNSEKSTVAEIRTRFDADVERFSNLDTGQQTTIDAPKSLELITEAAKWNNTNATHLLDIGCGAGNFTLKMLQKIPGLNCMLLDLSEPMLNRAEQRVAENTTGKIECIQADIRDIELAPNSFDIIFAGAVLHHLRTDKEWEDVFYKIVTALKPNGSFWIADLICHDNHAVNNLFWENYADYLIELGGKNYQQKVFEYIDKEDSPKSLYFQLNLLDKVGFKNIEVLHKNSCFAAFGAIK